MAEMPKRSGGWLRAVVPWLIAAGILGYLVGTTDFAALGAALERVTVYKLVLLALVFTGALLLADSLAMWIGFREALPDTPWRFGEAVYMRGATYLLAILNYGAGQGGIVYFLSSRHQVPVAAGAGAVLVASGAFIIVLALGVGLGLLAGAVPNQPQLRWVAVAVVASLPVYFAVIAARPRFLYRRSLLRPLFDAGVLGTLRVAGARAVHLGALIAGHWMAMYLFGIRVPWAVALALLPVLFLVAAIPISPSGLGTTQAAAITLFGGYASAADEATRRAQVLAYSLSFHLLTAAMVASIGLLCLRSLTRPKERNTTAPESGFDTPPADP